MTVADDDNPVDTPRVSVRSVPPVDRRRSFDTSEHLEHAARQAIDRRFDDFTIVDVDAHHYETQSWPDIVKYIEDPVIRYRAEHGGPAGDPGGAPNSLLYRPPNDQSGSGRIVRYGLRSLEETPDDGAPRDVTVVRRTMDSMGIDYQIVFPTPMLELGVHPDPRIETALSWAYTRWFTEEVLPCEPRIKHMVYLPFNDPDASLRMIDQFADAPGVVGFMVTSARYRPVHHNDYAPVYRALEERGKPVGFHAIFHGENRLFESVNRFMSLHALGFVIHNLVHMTNLVVNGIPERFPGLKIVWIESGLAWVPFIMQRLDSEYKMRTSDAPLLRKLPSEYMRDFFYTSQPMEAEDERALAHTFEMIDAPTQLLYASDYPHWDFDLPRKIYDLPFLDESAKRAILGGNAMKLFGLQPRSHAASAGAGATANER